MNRCHIRIILIILVLTGTIQACEKEEGEGGTSTITGKVYVLDYDGNFSKIINEYYAPDEDVYIIYGNDKIYGDDFKTHYDGTYHFQYLQKGKYTVYAYSKDSTGTSPSGVIPIMKEVNITENNQTVEVEDLVILD